MKRPLLTRGQWFIVAYAAAAPTVAASFYAQRLIPTVQGAAFARILAWQAFGYALWALLVVAIAWLARTSPRPLLALTLASLPITFTHALATGWWTMAAHPSPAFSARADLASSYKAAIERLPVDLLIYFAIAGLIYARDAALLYAEERAASSELQQELTAVHYRALSERLKPHFLFNTLHTIIHLIETDPPRAAAMTRQLSDVLRLTLDAGDAAETTVHRELHLVAAYLGIQQTRFPELRFDIHADDDALRCVVPSLLLQPIVENAVMHGLQPRGGQGAIAISIRRTGNRLHLEVSDDGVGVDPAHDEQDEGIGLSATRGRLRKLYGNAQALRITPLQPSGTRVTLDLPAREVAAA
jgi:two-component system LytT family sensor kinase